MQKFFRYIFFRLWQYPSVYFCLIIRMIKQLPYLLLDCYCYITSYFLLCHVAVEILICEKVKQYTTWNKYHPAYVHSYWPIVLSACKTIKEKCDVTEYCFSHSCHSNLLPKMRCIIIRISSMKYSWVFSVTKNVFHVKLVMEI